MLAVVLRCDVIVASAVDTVVFLKKGEGRRRRKKKEKREKYGIRRR
jgi:hypothetical protein